MNKNKMTDMKKQLLASFRTVVGLWVRTICLTAVLALNVPLAVTGVVFLAVHFVHVYGNLRG